MHAIEPDSIGLPFARTLIIIRSHRVHKRTANGSPETRFYLSSREPAEHTPAQWLDLIRGHWAGVENRNHWRRDALFGEDRSRTRNVNALANLALLRSACLRLCSSHWPALPIPHLREQLQRFPSLALRMLRSSA